MCTAEPASLRDLDRKVMVTVGPEYNPVWWRGVSVPPPAEWAYVFESFTGEDTAEEWAIAAAVFVVQTRSRTGHGPTFTELFSHLLPETAGLPGPFPKELEYLERRRVLSGYRGHVTIEWRRRGMISWDKNVPRSLRVSRGFRERTSGKRGRSAVRGGLSGFRSSAIVVSDVGSGSGLWGRSSQDAGRRRV